MASAASTDGPAILEQHIDSSSPRTSSHDLSDASPTPSAATSSSSAIPMHSEAIPNRLVPEALEHTTRVSHKTAFEHVETTKHDLNKTVADGSSSTSPSKKEGKDTTSMWSAESASPKPARRRFAPEPIETSTRSNKNEQGQDATSSPPPVKRKFAPEPIETSSRSSAKTQDQPKPRRKFAVEPVESSARSSKDKQPNADKKEETKPKRRFAPEPVENSTRSSKDKSANTDSSTAKPKRKFAVQPVETTIASSKGRREADKVDQDTDEEPVSPTTPGPSRSSSSGRKFTPELLETAKGSYRKQQRPPRPVSAVPKWLRDELSSEEEHTADCEPEESKFSAAALARKARADPRRHSYSVPDLPMIQSDSSGEESEVSANPSLSDSQSDYETRRRRNKDHTHVHKSTRTLQNIALRHRLSQGLGIPELDDATLREQAIAAYMRDEAHVSVSHFGGEDDDAYEDVTPVTHVGRLKLEEGANPQLFRRMSHDEANLLMQDMRDHHAQLENAKRELREDTAGVSRFSAAALAARHHLGIHHPSGNTHNALSSRKSFAARRDDQGHDDEYKKMRAAASPPMAGEHLDFPFSVSPKQTRCETDQIPRPRRADSDTEEHDIGDEHLWSVHIAARPDPSAGLWGGMCQKDDGSMRSRPTTPLRSGLQTPAFEAPNPFGSATPRNGTRTPRRPAPWTGMAFMPLTPPRSNDGGGVDEFTSRIDSKLQLEAQIAEEFPNAVITQLYNYLSLGYPPLARPFDEELSKISRIPIAELRRSDRSDSGNMKGHIGTPEGEGEAELESDGSVKGCKRWEALKLYVREWARQSPNFRNDRLLPSGPMKGTEGWGANAPVRKGSWAH